MVNGGGSQDAGGGGARPTSNQQPQPQDLMPQRYRRTMRMTRAQGRETRDRIGEGGEDAKKREKFQKAYKRDMEDGGDLDGRAK